MGRFRSAVRRYPIVAITPRVAFVGGVVALSGHGGWAQWVISGFALVFSGGEALEDYAAGRAKRELSALLARAPQIAHRLGDGTGSEDIPVGDVAIGDM